MEETGSLRIAVETKDHLALDEMLEFQLNLKSLAASDAEKLRKEMLTTGFAFPIFVWKNKGKNWILGGHQRHRVLKQIEADGIRVPRIPVVFVKAKNVQEAKRRVLQDVAQFGKVEGSGLFEFINQANIDVAEIISSFRLPDIELLKFQSDFFPQLKKVEFTAGGGSEKDLDGMPEYENEDKTSFRKVIVHFKSQSDVDDFSKLVGQKFTNKTRSIWHPKAEIETMMDKRYSSEP